MATNDADNANLWIVDYCLEKTSQPNGVVILPSRQAWEQYQWTHQYFSGKPKQGYFIWVKEQPPCPLSTLIEIQQPDLAQNLTNLLVVEAGARAELGESCRAAAAGLRASHHAVGTIVLRPQSQLNIKLAQDWGRQDQVKTSTEFILEEDSSINYTFRPTNCPSRTDLKAKFVLKQQASAKLNIIADCKNTEFNSVDEMLLTGKGASGISNLRFISRDKAVIKADSKITAEAAASGHLDCQSLNLSPSAQVSLSPEVVVNHNQARVTHEASIGKVSQKQLNYLRMRGLSESEAIELIVSGFLQPAASTPAADSQT